MKDTFTTLETLKTVDNKTVIFRERCVTHFFKTIFQQNYLKLSPEEKEEVYFVDQQYGDILDKAWKEPVKEALKSSRANWVMQDEKRNPIEEYNHALSIAKDADLTEEAHQIKMERLRLYAELFAKENN
jgi:hypothetical protein